MKNISIQLKRMILSLVLFLSLFIAGSCDSFVDVPPPNSQLTGITVFADNTTATAAMKDIYAKMRDTGLLSGRSLGLSNVLGQYTDELLCYQTGINSPEPFFNNALDATNGPVLEMWNATYNQIYAANAVIAGVNASTALTSAQKNQLVGEALFVRAMLHSYLAGLFGSCPYITTTDYELNSLVSRQPKAQVYANCIDDLLQAETLLGPAYVAPNRARPNVFAVKALLARLYLYNSQWAEASNAASAVLNETGTYVWETDLNKVFLKGCKTTIWQFAPGTIFPNSQEGPTFIFNAGPPTVTSLSPAFYAAFEAGDQRQVKWTRTITSGSNTWYHAYKYKQGTGVTTSTEHSIILRLAEQYLIRAEARARLGELTNAKQDLNFIRNTAGLGNTPANTATEILDAVLQERRFELFTELGHRFFDLQRFGKLDIMLTPVKPGWNTTDALWPVPQAELLINPNLLPQNAGY
ncbi:MAG: RagB/SusD family nutrient uptake outer membrane protein [Flavobacterium sp. JAD_PAG50586_2]|nr:MAG: RagB/SusD family nutrient uptake outer membrane protein [Flavobacterium sp. JAD_PAG50586_2]